MPVPVPISAALPVDATVTHLSGLHARGVHVGLPWPLRFAPTHRRQVRRPRLRVTRGRVLPPTKGRLASAEHCFATACAELDLVDAVMAGDWLLRLGHTAVADLAAYVDTYYGPGAPTVRARWPTSASGSSPRARRTCS